MSSSSSSLPLPSTDHQHQYTYEVFLSFRGEDTRCSFTDHLYAALDRRGIKTFRDNEELNRGEDISQDLLKVIEESRVSIIVFSQNYASSRWCLNELVHILECRRSKGQEVRPVFYRVDPSDVLKQTGAFGEAFAKLERSKYKDSIRKWRAALTKAANLSGWHYNDDKYEAKLIDEIVELSAQLVNPSCVLHVVEHPVGLESCREEVNRLLDLEEDAVRMVGICGTVGIGKTTIAKYVFNSICHKFEGSCFLSDVKTNSNGLAQLQKKLLSDVLGVSSLKVYDVHQGMGLIKTMMKHKKVLLILDDVSHSSQLQDLVPSQDCFGPGSRILICTRNRRCLREVDQVYDVKMLDDCQAMKLFSLNAFRTIGPPSDYLVLAERAIRCAQGLPVALIVLGSDLCCRHRDVWESTIRRWKWDPHPDIQGLKLSYDALGEEIEIVMAAESAGEGGMLSRPLPHHEIVEDAKLRQVEDEHETLPHHLKRLFLYCSLFPFGYEFRKDELVQLWIAEGFIRERQRERMEDTATEHFNALVKEGLFVFSGCDFTMDFDSVILYKVNPSKHSLLEETISSGNYFRAVDCKLDGASPMTRHLSLIGEDIDGMAFGVLQNFKHLSTLHLLSCCGSSMKHVPRDLCFTLTFLKTLNLSGTSISELPSSIGNVKSLRYIDASHTQIAQLPESIDSLHNLQTIKLRGCVHFVQLPKGMKKLSNLRHIDLDIIRQLDSMPGHLGNLTNLQTLPAFLVGRDHGRRVGELKNLNDLKGSFIISRLENVLCKEEAREASLIEKKRIHRLELRWSNTFDGYAQQEDILECLQPHTSLVELQIQQYSGSIIPNWISNPAFADLVVITLYRCRNCKLLPCLGQLPALKSLSIIEVNEVKEINHQFFRNVPVDHAFPKLESLEIDTMLSVKEWKDLQMGDLSSLIKLTVDTCPELVTIPLISCLKSLKHLEFRHCPKLLSLPADGLPTGLESFVIVDCHELKEWCRNSDHWSMLICHVPSVWFDNQEGAFGMTHQQAQAQVTAQASQSQSYTFHIPNEHSTSMTQLPVFSSSTTPPQDMPTSRIPDSGVSMRESSDISHSEQISQPSSLTVDKPNDDGYNWREYGQKQVKGSEFPRSYYKCMHSSCPVKKKVERSVDGQITEIIYKDEHNHQRPVSKRPKDSGNQNGKAQVNHDLASQVHGGNLNKSKEGTYSMSKQGQESSQAISGTSDGEEVGDAETKVGEKDEDEPDAKRRNMEVRHSEPASSHRTVTESRIIVQTTSGVDLLDDGYRWRKYGQKAVKGNPYPRSYYKCTFQGCNVRKRVERAATDPRAVITTYEGKHNHDVPASKSGSHYAANNKESNLGSGNLGTEKHASNSKMDPRNNDQQAVARLCLKEEQSVNQISYVHDQAKAFLSDFV